MNRYLLQDISENFQPVRPCFFENVKCSDLTPGDYIDLSPYRFKFPVEGQHAPVGWVLALHVCQFRKIENDAFKIFTNLDTPWSLIFEEMPIKVPRVNVKFKFGDWIIPTDGDIFQVDQIRFDQQLNKVIYEDESTNHRADNTAEHIFSFSSFGRMLTNVFQYIHENTSTHPIL